MTKRLAAKIGTYEKDGQTKGRYVNLGVILSNDNGEYLLLDPSVSLSGAFMQQAMMNREGGKSPGEKLLVSVFTDEPKAAPQGGGYSAPAGEMDDEIPF